MYPYVSFPIDVVYLLTDQLLAQGTNSFPISILNTKI